MEAFRVCRKGSRKVEMVMWPVRSFLGQRSDIAVEHRGKLVQNFSLMTCSAIVFLSSCRTIPSRALSTLITTDQ